MPYLAQGRVQRASQSAFAIPGAKRLLSHAPLNPDPGQVRHRLGAVIKKDPLARNALAACRPSTKPTLENDDATSIRSSTTSALLFRRRQALSRDRRGGQVDADRHRADALSWTQSSRRRSERQARRNPAPGNIDGLLVLLKPELNTLDETAPPSARGVEITRRRVGAYARRRRSPRKPRRRQGLQAGRKQAADELTLTAARQRSCATRSVRSMRASARVRTASTPTSSRISSRCCRCQAAMAPCADDVLLKDNKVVQSHRQCSRPSCRRCSG